MSGLGQIVIVAAVIGLVCGAIATGGGKGLLLYVLAGIAGSFIFPAILPMLGIWISVGDPTVRQMVVSTPGAIIFVLLVWVIMRLRHS